MRNATCSFLMAEMSCPVPEGHGTSTIELSRAASCRRGDAKCSGTKFPPNSISLRIASLWRRDGP